MIYEKKIKIKISARFGQFLISSWMEKGHEPSWKSFSSSSGSSQLGSDSSLGNRVHIPSLFLLCKQPFIKVLQLFKGGKKRKNTNFFMTDPHSQNWNEACMILFLLKVHYKVWKEGLYCCWNYISNVSMALKQI